MKYRQQQGNLSMIKSIPDTKSLQKFSEMCFINPRLDMDVPEDLDVSFIPMSAVSERGKIDANQSRKFKEVKNGYTYFREEDVLFAKITPCMENGKRAIARNLKNGIGFGSTEFHVLRPRKEVISEWIYILISSEYFRRAAAKNMTGTAGQKRVPVSFLENFKIPVPPLPTQRKIAAVLEKAESALEKRREANRLTSEFLKSAFLEMFGDPVRNTRNVRGLPEICEINPRLGEKISQDAEVSFVPMNAVSENGEIDVSYVRKYEDVKKGYTYFSEGDVLFAKITPCMENGKGAIAKNLKNGIGFGSTEFHVLRPYKDEANCEWLYFLLSFKHIREIAAIYFTGTAGQKRVPVSFLENLKVSVPSYKLQQKFSALVEKMENLKQKQRASETELQNLFNSLMQRAFRGA